MSLEKYSQSEYATGALFEEESLPINEQKWNKTLYAEYKKERQFRRADEMIVEWAVEQGVVATKAEWFKATPEEKVEYVLDWFVKHQPENFDPNDPITKNELLMNLYTETVEAIAGRDVGKQADINFYSTLHSMPDSCYGIDCFIDVSGIKYTIDISLNEHKLEHKADLILRPDMVYDENGRIDREKIKRLAQDIKTTVQRRQEMEHIQQTRKIA